MTTRCGAPPPAAAWQRLLAALLVGMVIGSALTVPAAGRVVERLRSQRDHAENARAELAERVQKLEEDQKTRRWALVVQGTYTFVEHPDLQVRLAVERLAQQQMNTLVGRPVADLDPHFVFYRLHGRTLGIQGRTYSLQVRHVLLAARATVYVQVEEVRVPAG